MAIKDFLLPDLGEGLTEGEIVSWLVAVGDTVVVDQPVAEIETAKAVVQVPSPFAGTVATLHGEVGEEVEVGKPLLSIDVGARPPSEPAEADPVKGNIAPDGVIGGSSKDAEVGDLVPQPGGHGGSEPPIPPDVDTGPAAGAADQGLDAVDASGSGSVLVGYGTSGASVSRRRRQRNGGGAASGTATRPAGKPLAKPPVRKLARDRGVDLTQVTGSGPGGVITRNDIEVFVGNGATAAPAAAAAPVAVPQPQPVPAAPIAGERRIPVRGIRKAIAEKMAVSRREIPEATSWVDCDATGLWEVREALNEEQGEVRVSPLALILRVVVAGLRKFPEVNASLDTTSNEIVVHEQVNLGFAADTERGLIVPVIRNAHRMSLLEIAAELNRLAQAARDGSVTPEELTGGTFTVTNYGSFGVDGGSAVINHPEAAILGTGRITDRPWVVYPAPDRPELAVRKVMQLSLAFDHRICDGGEAAGFLRFVADCVESPTKLLASL